MFPDCFHSLDVFVAFGRPVASERIARHQGAVFVFNRQDGSAGDVRRSVVVSSHDEDKRERETKRGEHFETVFILLFVVVVFSRVVLHSVLSRVQRAHRTIVRSPSCTQIDEKKARVLFAREREREREYNHATKSNAAQNVFVAKTMTR